VHAANHIHSQSGVINNEPFQTTFHNPSAGLLGTIVAIYEVGCCVGALITSVIGESLGRRRTICLGAVVMLAGAGFQAGVSSAGAMIGARIVAVSVNKRARWLGSDLNTQLSLLLQ
jgi:MFS family permease